MASLGGSFYSEDIKDYYLTPYDLGYGPFVKFDHEFVGRAALEKMAANPPRQKVTLVWNGDDVARVFGSLFSEGDITKYMDLPLANYSTLPYDRVTRNGGTAGLSTYTGYIYNERAMNLAGHRGQRSRRAGHRGHARLGRAGTGTSKPTVERHTQADIRATVQPVPISEVARVAYRPKTLA